jgi:RND family efflux transporter MFP subunit
MTVRHPAVPALLAVVLAACGGKPPPAAAPGRVVNITTATVARRPVEETEWAVGLLESVSAPPVSAEVAGRVVRLLVDEGQSVTRGQVLAQIDSEQYRLAGQVDEAEVGRLAALVKNKELELNRAQRLFAESLVSREQLDTIGTDLDALKAQLRGAQAQAGDSNRRLGEASITAPFAGKVARRNVDVGEYVQAGTAVFDLVDTRALRVRLPFPEYRAPQLRPGLSVRLTSASAGDTPVAARVTEVQPSINPSNRSLAVIVDFENPGNWLPGGSVRADVVLATRPDAMLLPQTAVVRRPSGDVVYVIEDAKARERPVRRGRRSGELLEITDGLAGTETVAVDGAGFLTNGVAVKVVGDKP